MERFYTIRFKRKTALRFKQFSKKVSKTYSETLCIIMNFFEWHGFLPTEKFEKGIQRELLKNRKRTEALIAILRNIEKNDIKPTTAMLLSLFEGVVEEEEEETNDLERYFKDGEPIKIEDITASKAELDSMRDKLEKIESKFGYVLDNIKIVKPSLGKTYLKVEITENELIKLKRILDQAA